MRKRNNNKLNIQNPYLSPYANVLTLKAAKGYLI